MNKIGHVSYIDRYGKIGRSYPEFGKIEIEVPKKTAFKSKIKNTLTKTKRISQSQNNNAITFKTTDEMKPKIEKGGKTIKRTTKRGKTTKKTKVLKAGTSVIKIPKVQHDGKKLHPTLTEKTKNIKFVRKSPAIKMSVNENITHPKFKTKPSNIYGKTIYKQENYIVSKEVDKMDIRKLKKAAGFTSKISKKELLKNIVDMDDDFKQAFVKRLKATNEKREPIIRKKEKKY
jgi:hypothetical protein